MTSAQDEKAGTTPEQRMLRASAPPDFLESADEWRRLFSEAWGPSCLSLSPLAQELSER